MKTYAFSLLCMLFCMLFAAPAVAAISEPTWKGYVVGVDRDASTLFIEVTDTYGCEFSDQTNPVCEFTAIEPQQISAGVPDSAVYDVITVGDSVIGESYGGLESTQLSGLAKLVEGDTNSAEALFGDMRLLRVVPLASDYSVTHRDMQPDCNACTDTSCPVTSVSVVIQSDGSEVASDTIAPGQSISYSRGDGSGVTATFISGDAPYFACNPDAADMMPGQPPERDGSMPAPQPRNEGAMPDQLPERDESMPFPQPPEVGMMPGPQTAQNFSIIVTLPSS